MDIKTLKPVQEDDGIFTPFPDPAGAPILEDDGSPAGAVVSGTYSKFYRDAQRKQKAELYRAAQRGEDVNDQEDDANLAIEAACIRSWTLTADGAPYPVTFENWKAIVGQQPQWRSRVQRQMQDHASFFNKA